MKLSFFENIIVTIKKIYGMLFDFYLKHKKIIDIILVCLIFILSFLMFRYIEVKDDDELYTLIYGTNDKLTSIKDVFVSQYTHYMEHGGRSVAHTALQMLFVVGNPISSIIYSLLFIMLGYEISSIVDNKHTLLILVFGLLFFINPFFEETVRWVTGFCNYSLTMLVVLIAVKPFIMYIKDENYIMPKWYYILLPISLLAGWTNENIGPTMCLYMLFVIIYKYVKTKKIDLYMVISLILAGIGSLLMIFAPGNFVRTDEFDSGLMDLAYRGHGQINAWFNWLLIQMVIFAILRYINKQNKTQDNKAFTYSMLYWYVLSILIMIASPSYPQRATYGSFIILLILIIVEVDKLCNISENNKKFIYSLSFVVCIAFIFSLISIDLLSFVRAQGVYIPN